MLLSRIGYYADFVVFPLFLLLLGTSAALDSTVRQGFVWAAACLTGIAGYSLLEYVLHRAVLHHISPFRRMHELHHANPTAMVGTPTWMTAAFAGGVFLALWWATGWYVACGITFGLILGYLWYVILHHAVHRWPVRKGSFLQRSKRRHALHHYSIHSCNFGVTTAFWDQLFGSTRSA